MFASANRAEEHRPWAIIRARLPANPHIEVDIMPAVIKPM